MIIGLILYFFFLGLVVGSFLNVVILRHNTGKTTGGRSSCMSCKTQLTWRELIPVFSFLFQKGRCKTCKTKLSWQYPLVEFVTGIVFAFNFYFLLQHAVSITHLIITVGLSSCILALMIVIFVYDLRHKIIPDIFSYTAWGLSIMFVLLSTVVARHSREGGNLVFSSLDPRLRGDDVLISNWDSALIHILAGLFFYFIIWSIWKLSKGRMIGLGDAKLLLSIGTLLGIVYGLSAIFISVWIGTCYALFLMLIQRLSKNPKHITMKTEIPFGPFLIIGFLIVYFFQIDVTGIGIILENFS